MSYSAIGVTRAQLCAKPDCIPVARPRKASKKHGLRYEKALARAIPYAQHGQWIEFWDSNGHHYCQPDLLLALKGPLGSFHAVLEAKLGDAEAARAQLQRLYKPVLRCLLRAEPACIVVVRHLGELNAVYGQKRVHLELESALFAAREQPYITHVLNWREGAPMALRKLSPQPPIPRTIANCAA